MTTQDETVSQALPRYRCHKEVWALKIASIEERADGGAVFIPQDTRYAPVPLSAEYMRKHNPKAGGYWILYRDRYQSWSPASEFEDGYTRISP